MTRKEIPTILCLFIALFIKLISFSQTSNATELLLPKNNEILNWNLLNSISKFSGDELYEFIDGGADLYHEYGFNNAVSADYINHDTVIIHCEIFKMKSDSAAFGIFSLFTSIQGKYINAEKDALLYDQYIEAWKGEFLIRISLRSPDEVYKNTLILFYKCIKEKIQVEGHRPQLASLIMSDTALFAENLKYFRGTIGLRNIFNFGYGLFTGFDEGVHFYSVEIQVFILRFHDEPKCNEGYLKTKTNIKSGTKFSNYQEEASGFRVMDKSQDHLFFNFRSAYLIIVKGRSEDKLNLIQNTLVESLN